MSLNGTGDSQQLISKASRTKYSYDARKTGLNRGSPCAPPNSHSVLNSLANLPLKGAPPPPPLLSIKL